MIDQRYPCGESEIPWHVRFEQAERKRRATEAREDRIELVSLGVIILVVCAFVIVLWSGAGY